MTGTVAPAAALDELRALEGRFGSPDDRYTYPGVDGSTVFTWVRGGVWLTAIAQTSDRVSLYYRRDARPASDIDPSLSTDAGGDRNHRPP